MAVKQKLIDKRRKLGKTQKEIADGAGISRSAYSAIERGLRRPSLDTALLICAKLEMPVEEAFTNEEKKE